MNIGLSILVYTILGYKSVCPVVHMVDTSIATGIVMVYMVSSILQPQFTRRTVNQSVVCTTAHIT